MEPTLFDFGVWRGSEGIKSDERGLVFRRLDEAQAPIVPSLASLVTDSGALDKDSNTGNITIDGTEGYITVPFSTAETAAMKNAATYEVRVTIGGQVRTWMYGTITPEGQLGNV